VKHWAASDGGQLMPRNGLLELTVTMDWLVSGLAKLVSFQLFLVCRVSKIARETTSEHAQLAGQDQ